MYQASAMKLTQENQARDEALRTQQAHLDNSLPPSAEVETES
jgi:hypothetical protein